MNTDGTMDKIERWKLKWKHGEAEVQTLGGMLAPVRFDIGNGRSVSPMQVAWEDDGSQVGLMRALRGEWPCLPFGMVDAPANLPSDMARRKADDGWVHGYGANHMWELADQSDRSLTLQIAYPKDGEIERLERKIEADPDAPALTVSLTVHARRDVVLPFALHPTFAVPASGVEILACPFDAIYTYPVPQEPGVSRTIPNRTAVSLQRIPTAHGPMDATRLPMPEMTEELLQIAGCKPPFVLRYIEQQADVFLDWNAEDLPDALLWISNGGRAHKPWSGRHFAVGVEPGNSFYDLGRVAAPTSRHPLADRKGLAFSSGQSRTISYRLSALAL
ncbi:hypothetical protein BZM27_37535 [Paraburkholderia steynii]|uniref:Aldose epimerase n=1 Tax=Paraburkholderia steynii TaxID=1245441 RepID=A0A4R0X440_9BURK|nr:hypothetical protein BZM27_37535 [Paraburkholderia steynii]